MASVCGCLASENTDVGFQTRMCSWPYTLIAMLVLLAIIVAATLSPPFGDVSGGAVSLEDGLVVEIVIEVDRPFNVVLARPFSSFEELSPTALSNLGDGSWGGFVEFPSAENWSLVFDGFESDGSTFRSDTTDLLSMGVDRVLIGDEPVSPAKSSGISRSSLWLIGALLLAVGSLAVLAWWTFSDDEAVDDTG